MANISKVKWNVNEASINRILGTYLKRNQTNVENIIENYAAKAELVMRNEFILKGSPTGTAWHKNVNNERGNQYGARRETGEMAAAVGYRAYGMNSDGVVGAEFGLPDSEYYLDQEYGFVQENSGGNRIVKGMNSAEKTINTLKPYFRKQMLAAGFLKGRKDARGVAVLGLMSKGDDFFAAWAKTAKPRGLAQREAWAAIIKEREDAETRRRVDFFRAQSSRELATLANRYPALAAELYRQSPNIDVRPFINKIGNQ